MPTFYRYCGKWSKKSQKFLGRLVRLRLKIKEPKLWTSNRTRKSCQPQTALNSYARRASCQNPSLLKIGFRWNRNHKIKSGRSSRPKLYNNSLQRLQSFAPEIRHKGVDIMVKKQMARKRKYRPVIKTSQDLELFIRTLTIQEPNFVFYCLCFFYFSFVNMWRFVCRNSNKNKPRRRIRIVHSDIDNSNTTLFLLSALTPLFSHL